MEVWKWKALFNEVPSRREMNFSSNRIQTRDLVIQSREANHSATLMLLHTKKYIQKTVSRRMALWSLGMKWHSKSAHNGYVLPMAGHITYHVLMAKSMTFWKYDVWPYNVSLIIENKAQTMWMSLLKWRNKQTRVVRRQHSSPKTQCGWNVKAISCMPLQSWTPFKT